MSGIKRWLDTMMEEVDTLQSNGMAEDEAIKQVATKHDVDAGDLAYYILGALVI